MAKRERINTCTKCSSFLHTTKQHEAATKDEKLLRMITALVEAGYEVDITCHIANRKNKFIKVKGNKNGGKKK